MFKRSDERKCPRLKEYNYSKNGYYFITICVDDMEHRFGFLQNGIMNLNESGKIIKKYWFEMPNVFNNCILDEFIIMPNHVHCIIQIDNENVGVAYQSTPKKCDKLNPNKMQLNIKPLKNGGDRWATPTVHGIPMMMRWFKSNTTKQINILNPNRKFKWQRSFTDRIIRIEKELYYTRQYIRNNPENW